jgi:hypothetical protein
MMGTVSTYEVILPGNALVLASESNYVTETSTGLMFAVDTPLEMVGAIIERLTRQQKRIEWAIGDALNFAEHRYGYTYAQWAEQTGLAENTLATIKWVASKVESSRRREDVGWSHHREVAPLPPAEQDALLEQAADKGMTRWELRQAVKQREESARGTVADSESEPVALPLSAADLTDEARQALSYRLAGVGARHRTGYEAGFLGAILWLDATDCLKRGTREER